MPGQVLSKAGKKNWQAAQGQRQHSVTPTLTCSQFSVHFLQPTQGSIAGCGGKRQARIAAHPNRKNKSLILLNLILKTDKWHSSRFNRSDLN
jgi:hypothetical protein